MNIYLLSQTENTDYDSYDSCVVIAKTEEEAKLIHPANTQQNRKYNYQYLDQFNRFVDLTDWTKEEIEERLQSLTKWYDFESDALDALLCDGGWCKSSESVTVKYLGEFKGDLEDYPSKVICASFNAG